MNKLIQVEEELTKQLSREYPDFAVGDMVKVHYKVREKEKERIQPLQGVVIKIQGERHRKAFTIRRIVYGSAYEITFPWYSPNIEKIEIIKKSKRRPRRARIYYIRKQIGKKAFVA